MPTTSDIQVVFTPINNIKSAQIMRSIRNECREFMTKSTTYITEEQQDKWFESLDLNNIKMFLMHIAHHGVVYETIGFGYCKYDGNETYLTGGILSQYRGKGYGKNLFMHLLENAKSFNTKITLEVLNTNTRAEKLYKSIGFVAYAKDERITKMEYKNDSAI